MGDVNFEGDGPGLTIIDGASSHPVFTVFGSTTITDLTIQNGSGGFEGGGISSFGQELNLSNIHFFNNTTLADGGALFILSPEGGPQGEPQVPHVVRIEGCLFSDNDAVEGEASCIYHEADAFGQESSDVIIANTTFSSNQRLAIRSIAGKLTLTHCTFYNNASGAFDASDLFGEVPGSSVSLNNSLVLDTYVAPIITSNGANFLADRFDHGWRSVLFQPRSLCSCGSDRYRPL